MVRLEHRANGRNLGRFIGEITNEHMILLKQGVQAAHFKYKNYSSLSAYVDFISKD